MLKLLKNKALHSPTTDLIRPALGAGYGAGPRLMLHSRAIFALVLVTTVFPPATPGSAQELFADSFDSGNTSRWSRVEPTPCTGSAPPSLRTGDLGPAPAAAFHRIACLEVRNDLDHSRQEIAYSSVPVPSGLDLTDTDRLVAVAGGRRVAAQFEALSRWGGPLEDIGLPIRWLSVALSATVDASSSNHYELRLLDQPAPLTDPWAVQLNSTGVDQWTVATGAASFGIDPSLPGILEFVDLEPVAGDLSQTIRVSTHGSNSGPRLVLDQPGGDLVLDASQPAAWTLDGYEWTHVGPLRTSLVIRGHLMDPAGSTLCTATSPTYEPLGYAVALTFERASRTVEVDLEVRNECSDGFGASWTDDTVAIHEASWTVALEGDPAQAILSALDDTLSSSTSGFVGETLVEQRKGGGTPWQRRARVLRNGSTIGQSGVATSPAIGLATSDFVALGALPWMRFREPQALGMRGSDLAFLLVSDGLGSDPLVVGEGKGLRARALLSFEAASISPPVQTAFDLRQRALARLERGLLVHADLAFINRSRILPSLGNNQPSIVRDAYLQTLDTIHEETMSLQWPSHKTYGSQLWPDNQFGQWPATIPSPDQNSGAHNYWNPNGVELLELLRSGDPKWAWDMALPQSWLQLFTAYLNVGDQRNSNRSGAAVTSGGNGEGQWHRSAFGSDDYTYNRGLHLAYALRPDPLVRHRFTQQGHMVLDRYSVPWADQNLRDFWTQRVSPERGIIQHFENLANCAEFSPGPDGTSCHERLLELIDELIDENFATGLFCQGDQPSTTVCSQPQQFMQSAMMHGFVVRMLLNYGRTSPDREAALERLLTESARVYYEQGMTKVGAGPEIDVAGPWAALLECTLLGGGTSVGNCTWLANSDGTNLLEVNKPHTLTALFVAHAIDPSVQLCHVARNALEQPWLLERWDNYLGNGWWKGSSQMLQDAVFALGGYDTCAAG